MALERDIERVLDRLSADQVEALATAAEGGKSLAAVVAGATVGARDAVSKLAAGLAAHAGVSGPGAALALRTALRSLQAAEATRSRPVWTGPCATGEQRLTSGVLHELISHAEQRILLVSFAAHTLPGLASDLVTAVQERGCDVDVVFETHADSAGAYSGPALPFSSVDGIRRWSWPPDRRQEGALLHAKLLVVDGRRALVGSANLTHRALTANLEVGVLLRDPHVATALEDHVRDLMARQILVRSD